VTSTCWSISTTEWGSSPWLAARELTDLLDIEVDVVPAATLKQTIRDAVLDEAVPL
jgi:predicted nucleotidyltransferase